MSSRYPAGITRFDNNASASPSADVYSTAMPPQPSRVQTPIEASQPIMARPRNPVNLPADASTRNAPYGSAQPMGVHGQQAHHRHNHHQPPQSPLTAATYNFQQLTRQINPFDADFEGAQRSAPSGAPVSYHDHPQGQQGSLQPTPLLQRPNVHTSQQLGHQSNQYSGQQAASMPSGDYLGYGGSSQPMRHGQEPNMYRRPDVAPQYVHHGHHYTDAGNSSHHQNFGHLLDMDKAMSKFDNKSPPCIDLEESEESSPEPSISRGDMSYFDTPAPHMGAARRRQSGQTAVPLSGSMNRSTVSQPHQEAPAHPEDNHRSRSTEATMQKNGQLFHRLHPGDRWEPAVKHSAIFKDLLQWAKRNSSYHNQLVKGKIHGDETAPVVGHETWGPSRAERPDILFQINKPERGTVQASQRFRWMWQGYRVLDRDGRWMWNWDDMPVTISSVIEGWHLEALMRRNPDMTLPDFQKRMVDGTPYVRNSTTLTNRTMRFRARSWNHTWGLRKASSDAHLEWLRNALPEQCIEDNSTRAVYRDPTQEEEKELEAFPKQTQAKKNEILAQRRRVRGRLLLPRAALASSSAAPMVLDDPALSPTNPRKRPRRDSIQSSTSEDFNGSALKRQKLLDGSSAPRNDEQVRSDDISPTHGQHRRHNDQIHRDSGPNNEEPDLIDSHGVEHRHGLLSTGVQSSTESRPHQYVDENAAFQWVVDDTQHPNTTGLSTANQPMLGHQQQQNSGSTNDDYDLYPELDSMDGAHDDDQDAQPNPLEPGNTALHQPLEVIDLESSQSQAADDDIEYMDDIEDAPSPMDNAKNDAQDAQPISFEPGNAASHQPPEVIDLEYSQPQAGGYDIEHMNEVQDASVDSQQEVDPAAHQSQAEDDELKDERRRLLSNLVTVPLQVGKSYMLICLDEGNVRRGLIVADGADTFSEVSIEAALHEIACLAVEPNGDAASEDCDAASEDGDAASEEDSEKQPEINAEQEHKRVYLPNDTSYIIVCIEDREGYGGVTPAEEGETFWDEMTLEAVVEALAGFLKAPTIDKNGTQAAYEHFSQLPVVGVSHQQSTGAPATHRQRAPAVSPPHNIFDEWYGDGHYLASVEQRAADAEIYPWLSSNGSVFNASLQPFSGRGSPTSSHSSLPDNLPNVQNPTLDDILREYFASMKKGKGRMAGGGFPQYDSSDFDNFDSEAFQRLLNARIPI